MMQLRFFILFLLGLILFSACSEFIEPDLEDKRVVLTAPANNTQSNKYQQTFWWEQVAQARTYRLQIAAPSFDSIAELVVDTVVSLNRFNYTLEPGKYQWRVRAENSGSQGLYSTHTLTIHQSSIATQTVQLRSPATGLLTNQADITFKWYELFGATRYRIQLDTNNFADEAKLVLNMTTPNVELSHSLLREKNYQWRLRAENDSTQSKWTAVQTFSFDATPPAKVVLSAPANNQIMSKPVSLQWQAMPGVKKYQLLVYKSDQNTVYNTSFPATITNTTSFSFTLGDFNETVYWKVRAIDDAGNAGAYSDLRQLTIQ